MSEMYEQQPPEVKQQKAELPDLNSDLAQTRGSGVSEISNVMQQPSEAAVRPADSGDAKSDAVQLDKESLDTGDSKRVVEMERKWLETHRYD